jgi:uncharacterized protein (DUF305 family)
VRPLAFYAVATLVTTLAMFVASCHATPGQAGHSTPTTTDAPLISGEPVGDNTDDTAFATTMLSYYAKASLMASLVAARSANSDLIAFAAKAGPSQQTNTETLKALLVQWNENTDTSASAAPSPPIAGDIDDATVAKLTSSSGAAFDTIWLPSMIAFDRGAIAAANVEVAKGKNIDAVGLAKQIVATLTDELGQLQQMLS